MLIFFFFISNGLEHAKDLENESEKSPLWKYCSIQHGGKKVAFKIDALESFRYPMVRHVVEGARVRLTEADTCMNSKSEFHQQGKVRVIAIRGNLNEEQIGVFPLDGGGGGTRGRGRGSTRWRGTRPREQPIIKTIYLI